MLQSGPLAPDTEEVLGQMWLESLDAAAIAEAFPVLLEGSRPARLRALENHYGLKPWKALFFNFDAPDLKEAFEKTKEDFPSQARIPRSLLRQVAEKDQESIALLDAEVRDQLLDDLDLDNETELREVLPPDLTQLLDLLAVARKTSFSDQLLTLCLAAFVRLWNFRFYHELEAQLTSEEALWDELAQQGRPDLQELLLRTPQARERLKQLLEGHTAPSASLMSWMVSAQHQGLPTDALAQAVFLEASPLPRDFALAIQRMSSSTEESVPLRTEPGLREWALFRRNGEEEIRAVLDLDPTLGWLILDRLGVVSAVSRLSSYGEESRMAPGLKAFVENLESGEVRGDTVSEDTQDASATEDSVAQEPAEKKAPKAPRGKASLRKSRKKVKRRLGYTWSA